MAIKRLKNGDEFMVGERIYRVIDDELFEVVTKRVTSDEPNQGIISPYPSSPSWPEPTQPYWYLTGTGSTSLGEHHEDD